MPFTFSLPPASLAGMCKLASLHFSVPSQGCSHKAWVGGFTVAPRTILLAGVAWYARGLSFEVAAPTQQSCGDVALSAVCPVGRALQLFLCET